jgi:hypothetical protein
MSQLVFDAVSGGSITLTGTNTASAYNLIVPANNGTILIQDGSNTLTVTNLTVTGLGQFTSTGAVLVPVGTTAQHPVSPVNGMIRYNTDSGGFFEGYVSGQWLPFTVASPSTYYTVTYLMIAGGGCGNVNAGGGAGGLLTSSVNVYPSQVYTFVIGAGGVNTTAQQNGTNTTGFGLTAIGGGVAQSNGGSGGGSAGSAAPGNGVPGQGNNGGNYLYQSGNIAAGGGGGAGGNGVDASSGQSGAGGIGLQSAITGTSSYYAGGGGGAAWAASGTTYAAAAAGGNGGGGSGGTSGVGGNATSNSGGGGGGGAQINYSSNYGGNGGSGVVILSIPTAKYTGTVTGSPTVTTSGSNTIVKFTASGSYTA